MELTKTGAPTKVKRTSEAEQAFQKVKGDLCHLLVVYTPDVKQLFIVQIDTSDIAVEAILCQKMGGIQVPIVYIS